jgi:hypothetical protein
MIIFKIRGIWKYGGFWKKTTLVIGGDVGHWKTPGLF